ncbi:MAG TPA: hypothetical protein V6D50_19710 [Chroococcales cyanobacterium]
MSKNRKNHQWVRIPADWSYPKITLEKQVQAKTAFPDATRIQTGEIP